jgi:hypothetical protein
MCAVSFAQAAAKTVVAQLHGVLSAGDLSAIDERVPFRTPTDDYAVLLHLRPAKLPATSFAIDAPPSNKAVSAEVSFPLSFQLVR